jgi:hypothetical protein
MTNATTSPMSAKSVILLLLSAKNIHDIFPDIDNYNDLYKKYASVIHPDICKEKGAVDAMTVLNKYKNELQIGTRFKSDGISVKYRVNRIDVEGDATPLGISLRNYNILMNYKDEKSKHFQQYLPESCIPTPEHLIFNVPKRVLPLNSLGVLEQIHVNWILSRMLEFSAWLNQTHNVHCGINPDSIFIVPENHGIICSSFYHMTPVGHKLSTISGKYSNLYPSEIFKIKQATTNIDIECSKRTAILLLGDKSGVGNILRKTHDADIINFLQKTSYSPYDTYTEWRELLKKKFVSKFHPLNI